jgi:hypothetical protein
VRCPECSADVSALREFCPVCGAAMDPGVRGSLLRGRGDRPGERPKRARKGLVIGGISAVLVALGVTGQFNSDGPSGAEAQHQPHGPVTIEAEELHRAFRADPGGAGELYGNREMVVSGEFLRIVPDGYGSLDLRLKTSDPADQLGIDVAQLAIEDAKQLRPGQRVTVSCQRMGSGADEIWVQDCAIQPTEELAPPPAPTPPDPPTPEVQED